jgi:hypothetical protein
MSRHITEPRDCHRRYKHGNRKQRRLRLHSEANGLEEYCAHPSSPDTELHNATSPRNENTPLGIGQQAIAITEARHEAALSPGVSKARGPEPGAPAAGSSAAAVSGSPAASALPQDLPPETSSR